MDCLKYFMRTVRAKFKIFMQGKKTVSIRVAQDVEYMYVGNPGGRLLRVGCQVQSFLIYKQHDNQSIFVIRKRLKLIYPNMRNQQKHKI